MSRFVPIINPSKIVRDLALFFARPEPAMVRIPVLVEAAEQPKHLPARRY